MKWGCGHAREPRVVASGTEGLFAILNHMQRGRIRLPEGVVKVEEKRVRAERFGVVAGDALEDGWEMGQLILHPAGEVLLRNVLRMSSSSSKMPPSSVSTRVMRPSLRRFLRMIFSCSIR